MSDTPRTDAAIDFSFGGFVGVNFCRGLESELAAMTAECAELRDALRQVAQSHAWLAFGECRSYGAEAPLLSPSEADYEARTVLEKCRIGE